MGRPDLSLLLLIEFLPLLTAGLAPRMPSKLLHPHEKIRDEELAALAAVVTVASTPQSAVFQPLVAPSESQPLPHFPSEVQAQIRLERLSPVIEALSVEIQALDFIAVESEPLPVYTFKRPPRCKFEGARHGFSTSGPV